MRFLKLCGIPELCKEPATMIWRQGTLQGPLYRLEVPDINSMDRVAYFREWSESGSSYTLLKVISFCTSLTASRTERKSAYLMAFCNRHCTHFFVGSSTTPTTSFPITWHSWLFSPTLQSPSKTNADMEQNVPLAWSNRMFYPHADFCRKTEFS